MKVLFSALIGWAALLSAGAAWAQATQRDVPYWVSLNDSPARTRTGPSTEFPVKWIYQRKHLPVKVVAVHGVWRKIEDQDGDQGWMHVRLLSPTRSAVVVGDIAPLHVDPSERSPVSWRAEPGVIGRITECEKGWCLFDVAGRRGYVPDEAIWGEEALGK